MLFLIDYDRRQGKIVSLRAFEDCQRRHADEARLELEIKLNRAGELREVVLLDAPTEDALRKTHRRYFEDLVQLASTDIVSGNGRREATQ